MRFEAIEEQRTVFPVVVMCRVLDVSKSGYYEWRANAARREERESREYKLVRTIEAVHLGSKMKYGSPRIADRTQALGFEESESTVARRMRKHRIRSKLKRKFKATTSSDHKLPVAPNHLMQDFTAYRPNQIWMSDITYVPTAEGWLYVCDIIELYSKKIVGWTVGSRLTKELVISAYLKARRQRCLDDWLIFQSDRGCQYASLVFSNMLRRHRVIQSMNRRGNCWDSAPINSFWGRLKTECVYWERFSTRQEALATIHDWIELEYNVTRAHSGVVYATPSEAGKEFAMVNRVQNE